MKTSNVKAGVLIYLSAAELAHMGGIGTPVSLYMNKDHWELVVDEKATRSINKESANSLYPGRVSVPPGSIPKSLPKWSATEWETEMGPGPSLKAKLGPMGQPNHRTKQSMKKPRAANGNQQVVVYEPPAPTPTLENHTISLREAIEKINQHKDRMGAELVLSIDKDGYLEAHAHYFKRKS